MSYRPEKDDNDADDLNAYYTRKQQPKHNQQKGEADVLRDADRDCDAEDNFSYGKKGYSKIPAGPGGKGYNPKTDTIWDDSAWKDKS